MGNSSRDQRRRSQKPLEGLFFGFDQNVPVRIDLIDNSARPRSLSVSLTEDDRSVFPIEEYESGSGIVRNIPIEFVWTDSPSGTFLESSSY